MTIWAEDYMTEYIPANVFWKMYVITFKLSLIKTVNNQIKICYKNIEFIYFL